MAGATHSDPAVFCLTSNGSGITCRLATEVTQKGDRPAQNCGYRQEYPLHIFKGLADLLWLGTRIEPILRGIVRLYKKEETLNRLGDSAL